MISEEVSDLLPLPHADLTHAGMLKGTKRKMGSLVDVDHSEPSQTGNFLKAGAGRVACATTKRKTRRDEDNIWEAHPA